MLDDYKHLIPQFENSPVINALLDAINDSFEQLDKDLDETFQMFNIDKCSGEWLDNLGALVGVRRPVLKIGSEFLQTDNLEQPLDATVYYVTNAPTQIRNIVAQDDYYRMLIKAQIIRNNTLVYSVNAIEKIVLKILFSENVQVFYTTFDFSSGNLTVNINGDVSYLGMAFLQSYTQDGFGRKRWAFPWPPYVQTITINTV